MADPQTRTGATYENPAVSTFVDELHHRESEAMRGAVAAIAEARMPAIQVGPGDGAALRLLLAAVGARKVVEVGTLAGYSALWILEALPADGHLWTLERSSAHADVAAEVFARAGESHRVSLLRGHADQRLPEIEDEGPFDAVLVDADKGSHPAYVDWALANVRSGGLIVADNAYLFGYLAGREPDVRAPAEHIDAMQRVHRRLAETCPVRVCLPTPDGLLVALVP